MELYIVILKLFLVSSGIFKRYRDVIDVEYLRSNFPELFKLLKAVDKLRVEQPERAFEVAELEACFLTLYPAADLSDYALLFQRIAEAPVDEGAVVGYLHALSQRVRASKLAFAALDVAEGKTPTDEKLRALLAEYHENTPMVEEGEDESWYVPQDLESILASTVGDPGLAWRLPSLNATLGPLRKGDFGFIFARPETGKTSFLASECTFMAEQVPIGGGKVLWFNNEQPGGAVQYRLYQAGLGATRAQIEGHKERAQRKYDELLKDRIRVIDAPTMDRRFIERRCLAANPSLIVIDQLDKVGGFDADREDLRMGYIYQWARELAKTHAPVIGVSQADGSGDGIKYLHMNNVANAKTAKQAEADWILGIGFSYEDNPAVRGMSICKNKLLGGEKTKPKLRHHKWDVLLETDIGRYRDMASGEFE